MPNKQSENEEQIIQESPEENIQYEVDEPIILLDPRGCILFIIIKFDITSHKKKKEIKLN